MLYIENKMVFNYAKTLDHCGGLDTYIYIECFHLCFPIFQIEIPFFFVSFSVLFVLLRFLESRWGLLKTLNDLVKVVWTVCSLHGVVLGVYHIEDNGKLLFVVV